MRPSSAKVRIGSSRIGEHLTTWRKLRGLTAQQVAEQAGISRVTLRKIEQGKRNVSFEAFLNVSRALGVLDSVVKATDPYETDLGRSRGAETLPKRVR